jgi:A/G-specific adenine glycosylase
VRFLATVRDTGPMWSDGIDTWYAAHGRHDLPWRQTTDPWAVLVSELMLQQTSVARVLPRWERFVRRWPDPVSCASAPLEAVLREWQGLGYPRRARWLWLIAGRVSEGGWPDGEDGLRTLPGVGRYTARALLAFSDIGTDAGSPPPCDVNIGRVAARAALGREPHELAPSVLDRTIAGGRPRSLAVREYAYAMFDVGAIHCRAIPRCDTCALEAVCALRGNGTPVARRRGAPPYRGSLRELRGTILAAALADVQRDGAALVEAGMRVPGATAERCLEAVSGLIADGLLDPGRAVNPCPASSVAITAAALAPTRR